MCVAVRMKLISRSGWNGIVELWGVRCEVNLRLVPDVKVGEYVHVHAGFAIQRDLQATEGTRELTEELIQKSQKGGDRFRAHEMCA